MRLQGDLEERLRSAVQRDLYRRVQAPDVIRIEETAGDGRALVELTLQEGTRSIVWKIQGKGFGFLSDLKNADGAFFVLVGDDEAEAHIVECKRTVTLSAWSDAKLQMRSTLLRLRALAGVLGVAISKVVCYTAYCEDEIEPMRSPEPAAGKISIGDDPPAPEDAEDMETARSQFDWESERADLRNIEGPIPHRRLALGLREGVGRGRFSLEA